MSRIACEVCLDDIAGVAIARAAGADRVELCADLLEGGTTPSIGAVEAALAAAGPVGVHAMIRPRGGEFVVTPAELDVMRRDIAAMLRLPVPDGGELGFVIGALLPDGTVDEPTTRALVAAADGRHVTFHKAVDVAPDLDAALDALIAAGVRRVLTSGGRRALRDGEPALTRLVARAAGRITIMAGGKSELPELAGILERTGIRDLHFGAGVQQPTLSSVANPEMPYDTGSRRVTDHARIDAYLAAVGR